VISKEIIKENLGNCLESTESLNVPGKFKKGKVRDTYDTGDRLILITTDRQSAFDRILANVPFKGQVLNQVSAWWFQKTESIVKNHVVFVPDPNVTIAKKCDVFPVEFVVRGYLTGSTDTSAWTNYNKGVRNFCGNDLPDGMVKNQKFEQPILTPTTKSEEHDESISSEEIVKRGIINADDWRKLEGIAFALFGRGIDLANKNGLILVDTKYEFGRDSSGDIVLIDEIHTPDSSRYWIADSYDERFASGQEPKNIDKEFLRLWFKENCDPYKDKELPAAPEELIIELSSRYIQLFEKITGRVFEFSSGPAGELPILQRIQKVIDRELSAKPA